MKWGLVSKPDLSHVAREMASILDHLKKRKQQVVLESRTAAALRSKGGVPLEKMDADVYVTMGGDGTVLLTLEHTDHPVLAVNAGGLGFLSEVEPKYAADAIDRILRSDYQVDERTKLAAWLDKQRLPDAANEVTVQTAKIAKLIKLRIEVNDELFDTMRADGVIVATATGSTGYSLSVGGPILHPSVDALVVSPIAPFRLAARPLIVPFSSNLKITVLARGAEDEKEARVVVDGQHGFGIPSNGSVTVRPSERRARFIRFGGGFYERVRTKLTR